MSRASKAKEIKPIAISSELEEMEKICLVSQTIRFQAPREEKFAYLFGVKLKLIAFRKGEKLRTVVEHKRVSFSYIWAILQFFWSLRCEIKALFSLNFFRVLLSAFCYARAR